MISMSSEFEAALEKELERLVCERFIEYQESKEFFIQADKLFKAELDECYACIVTAWHESGDRLCLNVSSPSGETKGRRIDIETAIESDIKDRETAHLQFILQRLESMASKIREALS